MTTMPTDFPIWYAAVEAGQEGKAVARWTGVAKAVSSPQVEEVEALIRLALKTRQGPDQAVAKRIIENIRSGDPTFDTSAADREIQILAASALTVRLIPSDTAALALTTAHLDGARKPELPMDLFGMAENAVHIKAKTSRTRRKLEAAKAPGIEWAITDEQAAQASMGSMVRDLHKAATAAIQATMNNVNQMFQQLEHAQMITDEELQMLWWQVGGHMSSGQPIEDVKPTVRPLAVGRELAARTVKRPGPISIPALLSKCGLGRRNKVKVVDAVNAMDDAWSKSAVEGLALSPVSHPIHDAIRRRTETGAGPDWEKNWSAACEIAGDHTLTALRLSELFYRERLLLTISA